MIVPSPEVRVARRDPHDARSFKLPRSIARYFDAVAQHDLAGLGNAFTDDAEVVEVDRPIRGRPSILEWAGEGVIHGRYILHEFARHDGRAELLVTFVPPGQKTGLRARYEITTRGGRIARMVLRYE
jgi:hypothetical protein